MSKPLNEATKKQLAARVNYYREMGIYDFYRRNVEEEPGSSALVFSAPSHAGPDAEAVPVMAAHREPPPVNSPLPVLQDKPAALKMIREEIGECERCRLHKGRTNLVFGVGNVNADIM